MHFVGDLHQPLHAGYAQDRGGNDTQVNDAGYGTNLHALWDSRLLFRRQLTDDAYVAKLQAMPLAASTARKARSGDVQAWAEASCSIVLEPGFYPARPKLTDAYFSQWTPVAERQLRDAGTRLAQLLNASLGT